MSSSSPPVYDTIGRAYVAHRLPEPRWAAALAEHMAVAPDDLVVNVGAGTGNGTTSSAPIASAMVSWPGWHRRACPPTSGR